MCNSGGSIMASFETSLYDENLKPRSDFGLADLFGVSKAGDVVGTNGNAYYGRIEPPAHPILDRLRRHQLASRRAESRPAQASAEPVLTVVPGFVRYPPELAYPPRLPYRRARRRPARDPAPAASRGFPETLNAPTGSPATAICCACLHNTIRWVTHDESVVHVEGEGFIEMFCWETRPGYAVHLLNYTNPNAHHGWMQSVYPLGPQTVSMKLPQA